MNVSFPKNLLAEQLGLLERVIPSRSSNPLFTYLGLAVLPDTLVLFGSNGEADLEVRLLADVQGQGRYLVPAQPFFQLVRSLPGDLVELGLGQDLELASGRFRTRLSLAPTEGYPELLFPSPEAPSDAYPLQTTLSAEDLFRALAHVRYAASNEEYRAIFRGVQLEFGEKGVRAVASDGYRLALYDLKSPQPFQKKVVVPARSVDELTRVLKSVGEGPVVVALGQGTLGLAVSREGVGQLRMAVKLMEGEFPDYERVIPKDFPLKATLEVEAFRESLRRVSVLADRQNHRVDLFFQDDRVLLTAEGDYGKGQEELPVRLEGTPLAVAYNARYLLEAFGPLSGQASLLLSGPTSPSLVRPVGEGEGYQAVVVPLRV
ncbi:DNA polymerase III subunit beta [Thermus caliditerrae]|uniref:DNA polymerase III subunit beta n=1 Tax=Thermus caliditerrae TaxID=1330700 RepID=UPI001F43BFAE|nr:DNA polymerase III subunit beta [Thermus caliditerrae]